MNKQELIDFLKTKFEIVAESEMEKISSNAEYSYYSIPVILDEEGYYHKYIIHFFEKEDEERECFFNKGAKSLLDSLDEEGQE